MTTRTFEKDNKLRDYILNGNLWKVLISITFPLAIFSFFQFLYGFFDSVLAAFIGNHEVTSVAIFSEIQLMVTALGIGIASGTTILVSRSFGASDEAKAKSIANNGFFLTLYSNVVLVIIILIFGKPLLQLLNTPQDSINNAYDYFILLMISTVFIAINNIYNGLEKAKGNSKAVLKLNVVMLLIKVTLSFIFVFLLKKGILWMGIASLISQGIMSIIAIFKISSKNFIFRISIKNAKLKLEEIKPLIKVGTPIFLGNFLFNFGKVIVNSLIALYHPLAVGASSVVFRLGAGGATFPNAFKESLPPIISQNLGKKQSDRAWKAVKISLIYSGILGAIVVIYTIIFKGTILKLYINENSTNEYIQMILIVFSWEIYSKLSSAIVATITGMFQGFNYTKFEIYINLTRVFLIRIPLILVFQNFTSLGFEAYGIVLFASNTGAMIASLVFVYIFKKKQSSSIILSRS